MRDVAPGALTNYGRVLTASCEVAACESGAGYLWACVAVHAGTDVGVAGRSLADCRCAWFLCAGAAGGVGARVVVALVCALTLTADVYRLTSFHRITRGRETLFVSVSTSDRSVDAFLG